MRRDISCGGASVFPKGDEEGKEAAGAGSSAVAEPNVGSNVARNVREAPERKQEHQPQCGPVDAITVDAVVDDVICSDIRVWTITMATPVTRPHAQ